MPETAGWTHREVQCQDPRSPRTSWVPWLNARHTLCYQHVSLVHLKLLSTSHLCYQYISLVHVKLPSTSHLCKPSTSEAALHLTLVLSVHKPSTSEATINFTLVLCTWASTSHVWPSSSAAAPNLTLVLSIHKPSTSEATINFALVVSVHKLVHLKLPSTSHQPSLNLLSVLLLCHCATTLTSRVLHKYCSW
jgi:hypothetical protein